MIRGFIVNRFRGDPALFDSGMQFVAERTGWPALGLVPHFADAARLPAEDGLGLRREGQKGSVVIAVPVTPWISNFDDLDPLREEVGVEVVLVEPGEPLPANAGLVLLPGSKTTIDDLLFIRQQGWDIDLKAHVRRGGRVLGLCGGYQMLGTRIDDPAGIEGEAGRSIEGLALLDVATTLTAKKRLEAVTGTTVDGVPLSGYEMHIGETSGPDALRQPFARLSNGQADGAVSADGCVVGTYVHGLFADDLQRARWLRLLGAETSDLAYETLVDDILDRFADHLEAHLDCERLLAISAR
jgi:adenosylcobyric acid synthase